MHKSYVNTHIEKMILLIESVSKKEQYDILRRDMPYGFEIEVDKIDPKITLYNVVPFNRDYKPLGIRDIGEPVNYKKCTLYNSYLEDVNLEEYSEKVHKKESVYLYSDGNPPWQDKKCLTAYLNKIKKIYKLGE